MLGSVIILSHKILIYNDLSTNLIMQKRNFLLIIYELYWGDTFWVSLNSQTNLFSPKFNSVAKNLDMYRKINKVS